MQAGISCRAIARQVGRSPSTVSRDVAASGGRTRYRAWRAAGLRGVYAPRFVRTTLVDAEADRATDLVDRSFAAGPDRLWVADISVPQQAA